MAKRPMRDATKELRLHPSSPAFPPQASTRLFNDQGALLTVQSWGSELGAWFYIDQLRAMVPGDIEPAEMRVYLPNDWELQADFDLTKINDKRTYPDKWTPHSLAHYPEFRLLRDLASRAVAPQQPTDPALYVAGQRAPMNSTPAPARTERIPRPTAASRPKAKDGEITVSQIANEIGCKPSDARAILRQHMKDHEGAWSWPASDTATVNRVKELITKNLKKKPIRPIVNS